MNSMSHCLKAKWILSAFSSPPLSLPEEPVAGWLCQFCFFRQSAPHFLLHSEFTAPYTVYSSLLSRTLALALLFCVSSLSPSRVFLLNLIILKGKVLKKKHTFTHTLSFVFFHLPLTVGAIDLSCCEEIHPSPIRDKWSRCWRAQNSRCA